METFTRFSQMDPRWKDLPMGFDPQATIGSLGCLLTDLAMVASAFGFDETPASLNQKIKALGANVGFQGALVVPAVLPRILPGVIFRDFVRCQDQPAPVERIDAALAAGWPVIVELDYSPAAGLQNHWVLLYARKDGDYLIQDPYPYPVETGEVRFASSRFAFGGSLARAVTAVVWLEGPRPPVNRPEGAISVYATVDGLALRSQPVIDPLNLLARVGLGAELYSLESVDVTLHKAGSANLWLNVLSPDGVKGYAAAWYLSAHRDPPAPPPVIPVTGAGLKIYTSVDQVALRNQPAVAPSTLLLRLAVGTELEVLDPPETAISRLGVLNAWIQVKDPTGITGYVAAWYVTATPLVGMGPAATPPPEGNATLTVAPTVPSLALRTRPEILPETLIKRVPLGTRLQALEPAAEVQKKIGRPDQWLRVRDPAGDEGFIAAWYLKPIT